MRLRALGGGGRLRLGASRHHVASSSSYCSASSTPALGWLVVHVAGSTQDAG